MGFLKIFTLGILLLAGNLGIGLGDVDDCSLTNEDDLLPQDQFVDKLTNPCRYDRYERPNSSTPLDVEVKMDITHLEAAQSQFTTYITFQLVYLDINLNFENISSKRTTILGDESLKAKIWTPNVLINNNQDDTTIISVDTKNIIIVIDKTGLVTYTYKIVAKFDCWMDLQKFPFDHQKCSLAFSDWSYNGENLQLLWNGKSPVTFGKISRLTEFVMDDVEWDTDNTEAKDLSSKVGVFSELIIHFKFHRDIGFYLLDFFIPSYLLVFTAWVTFWLQADAGPPRATLGSSTIVAFITLHLGVAKDIPKVSYIKASDIWFLGVICFIFLSLAEFAFVNVIWRRKKKIALKKQHPKYILKSAVMPRKAREDLKRYESTQTLSIASLSDGNLYTSKNGDFQNSQESVNGHSTISIPDEVVQDFSWTEMTPQEVAIYIDRKARIVFPIAFLVFNILYWVFVYCV